MFKNCSLFLDTKIHSQYIRLTKKVRDLSKTLKFLESENTSSIPVHLPIDDEEDFFILEKKVKDKQFAHFLVNTPIYLYFYKNQIIMFKT